MRHIGRAGVFALLWLGAGSVPAHAEIEQRVSGRIQIGVVHDTNVLEELGDETADQHLSLFGSVSHRLAFTRELRLESSAQLGLLRYRDVENDSRVLGVGRWQLSYETPEGVALGGSVLLDGRDYADSASTRGYGLFRSEVFVRGPLGPFAGEVTAGRTLLDYKITPGQEQSGNRIDGALRRRVLRHVVVGVGAGTGSFHFNRRAVRVSGETPVLDPFDQRDEFVRVGVDVQYLRGVFVALGYAYLDNDSNSFGNTYAYHRVDVATRFRLEHPDLSLGLSLRLESRDYADDLSRFDVINFDSEREENNHVVAELARPVGEELSLKLRAGWHRNESVFRDRFYERFQVETHLEWQF
jgi:hypothetical protein